MSRLVSALAVATLVTGCSGALGFVPLGERNSTAAIQFEEDATHSEGGLLAFDPSRHSLDIEIALPVEQRDDIDVFIVTSNGVRFQVLGSFQDCRVEGEVRLCERRLPVLPDEGVADWRVEAQRDFARGAALVEVDVTWVPIGS